MKMKKLFIICGMAIFGMTGMAFAQENLLETPVTLDSENQILIAESNFEKVAMGFYITVTYKNTSSEEHRLTLFAGEKNQLSYGSLYGAESDRKFIYPDKKSGKMSYVLVDWHVLNFNPNQHLEDAMLFFSEISQKYAKYTNLIYELCNEPTGSPWTTVLVPYAENLIPMFITEFGTCNASGNGGFNVVQTEAWFELIKKYNISHMNWSLANKAETASIISADCSKTSDWSYDELSDSGKLMREHFKTLNQ